MLTLLYGGVLGLSLVGGAWGIVVGRRHDRSWSEIFQMNAISIAVAGFSGAQLFLPDPLNIVVAAAISIPAVAVSLRHTRGRLNSWIERQELTSGESDSPAETALIQANRNDVAETMAQMRRSTTRPILLIVIPILAVGVYVGSWTAAVVAGATLAGVTAIGRYITKPFSDSPPELGPPEDDVDALPPTQPTQLPRPPGSS